MSVWTLIADRQVLLAAGAAGGILLGPAAAAFSVTVPVRRWPWQSQPGRWVLGQPSSARRRWLISLTCTVVLSGLTAAIGWRPALAAFLVMGVIGVILAAIDIEYHRLPDLLVAVGALASGISLLIDATITGSWVAMLRGLICAVVVGLAFLIMVLISPEGMGLGDVKLAGLLGLHTGWLSWQLAALAVLGGFAAGSAVALVLVVTRRATLRTALPFGPALLAAAWLAILAFGFLG